MTVPVQWLVGTHLSLARRLMPLRPGTNWRASQAASPPLVAASADAELLLMLRIFEVTVLMSEPFIAS